MFGLVYFTPSSVPFFLAAAFSSLLSLYLLTLLNKSPATRWLGLAFISQAVFYSAYFLAASVFDPTVARFRWFTAIATFAGVTLTTRFFLAFPRETNPRAANRVMIIQGLFFLGLQAWWMHGTYDSELLFNFAAHSYDLSTDRGGVLGLFVLLALFGWIPAVFFQTRRLERSERRAVRAMLVAFLVTTVVPTVLYTLNRRGAVSNETYHLSFTFFHLLGYFLIAVLYLNTTPDRTTFLAKIVGVSLVTLLLYFQWMSFFALRESENNYDDLRTAEIQALAGRDFNGPLPRMSYALVSIDGRYPAPLFNSPAAETAARLIHEGKIAGRRGERIYRGRPGGEFFVSYRAPDTRHETEIGFDYLHYRETMHARVAPFLLLSIVFLFIVLVGFRIFLYGALVRPLNELLAGVREVNEGDLQVELRVRVEDEIGYLTRSFNSMIASIREARQDLEGYAGRLEEKVKERTAELRQSLERVAEMKSKQDGDYFLTSLLITPLGTNQADSETVDVDFYLRQKKRFTFRHWENEIGGDINISQSLNLRGRPCTVFLNGDAMGKSLQGAGGALVLGSVFEAVLERSLLTRRERDVFPERWLKNAFIELHKVFESFDGNMLVSMVMGVIDDAAGFLYFINAEHPDLVLYRAGRAEFLHPARTYTKLGMPILRGKIQVDVVPLRAEDVLIAGSDGRDDIFLSSQDESEATAPEVGPFINEDHTLFLRHVEQGDGRLERIVEGIDRTGELSDDLSLLRLRYHGRPARPDSAERSNFRRSLQSLLDARDFGEAFRRADEYLNRYPGDNEVLHAAAHCLKKQGEYSSAADFAERLRLRDPFLLKNLQNLAEIYYLAGNKSLARDFTEEILAREPDNARARKLLAGLD